MEPNWDVTPAEWWIIKGIVERASTLFSDYDYTSITMDIIATHNHACRLRLDDLLDADDFNFAHDIVGINHKLDRENLVLADGFWPRFATPDTVQTKR